MASNYTSTEEALRALIAALEFKTSGKYDFYSSNINSKNLPVFVLENKKGNDAVKDNSAVKNVNQVDKLPATGTFVDTSLLIALGMLFMSIGALYTRKIKSEK